MPPRTRNPITHHARAIRAALTSIERWLGRLVALTNAGGRGVVVERTPKKCKLKLSPQRLAQLKLQGQYIGYMRNLKPARKAWVKAVKAKNGMRAVIAIARRMTNS